MSNFLQDWINHIPSVLGKYAFLILLVLILLDVIFGGWLFYQYVFVIKAMQPDIASMPVVFQEKLYENVLKASESKNTLFQDSLEKTISDPFK